MQIVIDISENDYRKVQDGRASVSMMRKAIRNGIPLPKGHKRLIAEPTEEDIAKTIGGQNDFAECIREAVKAVFDNAPTIIEADNGESEE